MTKQQAQEYVAALERERDGYEARKAAADRAAAAAVSPELKAAKEAEASNMADRIAQVEEQIKWAKKAGRGKSEDK